MESIWQDLRYGSRKIFKNYGFTLIAVLTLALGIGANTAIFSVINAVLLRPLPFAEPDRLATVWNSNLKTGDGEITVTFPNFNDWRSQQQSFERLAAFHGRDLTLTGLGEAVRLRGTIATSDLFPLLGVTPKLGRVFTTDEDKAGNHAAILSNALWRSRFKADPNVVGRAVSINNQSYTIVGVMPDGFKFPISADPTELWIGAAVDDEGGGRLTAQRGNHLLEAIGRLKPGVSLGQAQAEVGQLTQNLARQYPEENGEFGARVTPFYERVVKDVRFALLMLLGAVGCVLLIACANVANLLLARAVSRQREMAVRAALGANRWRVIRQLLTESLILSLFGGGAGLLVAWWGTDLLLKFVPKGMPRVGETALDWRVLGFALLVSILTGVIFGLAPALHSSKIDLVTTLKEGSRGAGESIRGNRVRNILVVAQVAIAFTLLAGAGLLINSYRKLQQVDPGFNSKNLLSFRVSLPTNKYSGNQQIENFYQQLTTRVEALPGVTDVSAVSVLPLSGANSMIGFSIEGVPTPPNQPFPHESFLRIARQNYFRAMGIRLLQGRDFDGRDANDANQVVIINETLAHKFFPNQNPIGRRINPSFATDERGFLWREIIGVVSDVHHAGLNIEAGAECYVPHIQAPFSSMTMVARTSHDPQSLISSVRKSVASLDGDLPAYNIKTLDGYISLSVERPRFNTLLLSIFAVVALALTAIGLYGVMSYNVTQRTHEIGVRLALGAQPGSVRRLVVRDGMKLALIGVVIGIGISLALAKVIEALLFGVTAYDPINLALISALLSVVALLACLIPAVRATKVDPMTALRSE